MVAVHANWSAVYALTSKIRIVELIHYDNWRNPGLSDLQSATLFATQHSARPNWHSTSAGSVFAFRPRRAVVYRNCPGPNYKAVTCPQHTTAALPDFTRTVIPTYLGQKTLSNTIQLQADINKRISGRIGYMYEDRVMTDTGYFGGSVDYYETTGHIPPYASAIYYPGGTGGTAQNYFFAARGNAQFRLERRRFLPAAR